MREKFSKEIKELHKNCDEILKTQDSLFERFLAGSLNSGVGSNIIVKTSLNL
jgi:hypothetical protein